MVRANLLLLASGFSLAKLTPERSHTLPIIIVDSNLTVASDENFELGEFIWDFDIISGDTTQYGMRASMAVVNDQADCYHEIYVEYGFDALKNSSGMYLGVKGCGATVSEWARLYVGSLSPGNYRVVVDPHGSSSDPYPSWSGIIIYNMDSERPDFLPEFHGPRLRWQPSQHLSLSYTQWYKPWLDWSVVASFEGRPCLTPLVMRLNQLTAINLQNDTHYTLNFTHNPSYKINVDDRCGSEDTSFFTSGDSTFNFQFGRVSDHS